MSVIDNYKKIVENIKLTCKIHNRDFNSINLVAVSKQHKIDKIRNLCRVGHKSFGENRLQETLEKWTESDKKNVNLHFIGALQSKKIKDIIKNFTVIETLDTENSAKKLSVLKSQNFRLPKILVQINIGEEPQKRGVFPSKFSNFLNMCKNKYNLDISGAMCMPPLVEDPTKYFKNMYRICKKENLKEISMGMSNDYREAIICGSTNVRIGSLIFGERVA